MSEPKNRRQPEQVQKLKQEVMSFCVQPRKTLVVLCLGCITYRSTYLLPEDKAILDSSTFFSPIRKLKEHKIKRFGCELG